ncbi:MAG TPA: amidohydrolase [Chitinophagaceae bacterium]|nr:amidohydrolase [Chitinophagaceae bacterium]
MRSSYIFYLLLTVFFISFKAPKKVDTIVYNGKVYTVNAQFNTAQAFAISNGKIVAVGSDKDILKKYTATEMIDARGQAVYPGFIDAHAHFWGYGSSLQDADLVDTKSWDEVLQRLQEFVKRKNIQPGESIIGRGWDQNDWEVKSFPNKEKLDQLFPDNPVLLRRIDGHAAIANQKSLDLGGVKTGAKINGGEVEVKNGKLTGILIDNAIGLAKAPVNLTLKKVITALTEAQENCFAAGLTTIDDCGVSYRQVLLIDSLQKAGVLHMRIYAMLSDAKANYDFAFKQGKIKTDHLNVRSFKVYADGALGSRGAALLEPYTDRPGWSGFLLSSQKHFDSVANIISQHGFQMCTHAIGDSGNRTMLNIYGKYLVGKNDKRWRIEHAQVINENDFNFFGKYSIIPSVQPTHATSDMYWAGDRLGPKRVKGAYAFNRLLKQNGWIPLGTDFPVEDISPFKTFYAAVFRIDAKGWPKGGYQMENALSRMEALKGMTIWAAKSNFEENEKGSLEPGKFADFIILDKDLMKVSEKEILETKVVMTFVGGKKVYGK